MKSYSQFQEDLVILDYFGEQPGVFLEIGAHTPKALSQTYLLEENGWRGVLIEPHAHLAQQLRNERPASVVFECGVAAPHEIGRAYLVTESDEELSEVVFDRPSHARYSEIDITTINQLLEQTEFDHIDFLSIDIEGMEVPALMGFDFARYRPRLILIEDHCEDRSKHNFLKRSGYKLVNRMGCNGWYVPAGLQASFQRQVSSFELMRKMYLAMPFRQAKRHWQALRGSKAA